MPSRPRLSIQDQTSEHPPANKDRFLQVGLFPGYQSKRPVIHLQGDWLLKAGFAPNSRVRIKVCEGCLVILPDTSDAVCKS